MIPPLNLNASVVVPWLILMRHEGSEASSVWSWRKELGCASSRFGVQLSALAKRTGERTSRVVGIANAGIGIFSIPRPSGRA